MKMLTLSDYIELIYKKNFFKMIQYYYKLEIYKFFK